MTCGDCTGFLADPLHENLVLFLLGGTIHAYVSDIPGPPIVSDMAPTAKHTVDLGGPPTLFDSAGHLRSPFGQLLTLNYIGARQIVLTPVGAASEPVDVAAIAPSRSSNSTLEVWRKQTLDTGNTGWSAEPGTAVPGGAVVLQAAGGHTLPDYPVYYVADVADNTGAIQQVTGSVSTLCRDYNMVTNSYDTNFSNCQTDRLFVSHRDPHGPIDGWDCIVPGPTSTAHNGQCATATAGRPDRAWAYSADPYDANIVYVLGSNGVFETTDRGTTWTQLNGLTGWVTQGGRIAAKCQWYCGTSADRVYAFGEMHFVPEEEGTRFLTAATGVYYTLNGSTTAGRTETWHRLLSSDAVNCMADSSYFHVVTRALYVACAGRGIIRFDNIPSGSYPRSGTPVSPAPTLSASPGPTALPPAPPPPPAPTPTPTLTQTPASTPAPHLDLTLTPGHVDGSCATALKAFQLTLDNSGSTVAASWAIKFEPSQDYPGDWGSADPSFAQVGAGQRQTITITPQNLCQYIKTTTDFRLDVAYGAATPLAVIYTVSPQ